MNAAQRDKLLPFRAYALHRGGEKPQARKIVDNQNAKGEAWVLDFVWSTPDFEKQLGGVKGLPSYYVIDSAGRIRAVVKGHTAHTLETLAWLIDEIGKRS